MRLSIPQIIFLTIIAGAIIVLFAISNFYGAEILLLAGIVVLAFAVRHRKNKSKARWQKHSNRRAGKIYNETQNKKKGKKNKKYKKTPNPNKKGNSKKK